MAGRRAGAPDDWELLIEVRACGLCPGDVRAWLTGFHEYVLLPANTGYEAAGVVVEAGFLGPALSASDLRQPLFLKVGTIVVVADSTLARLGSIAERRWGLVTTAQAGGAGVSRKQLARMASAGAIERVAQGVYRMAGAPPQDHEAIYATWLALGGATAPRTETGVAPVVAAGVTAAVVHGIGDFFPDRFDFIVPARKGTRLPGVRLRVRRLTRDEVIPVGGLPALTVERAIGDLIETGTDLSLVAGAVRDAVRAKLVAPGRLVSYLDPIAARRKSDGRSLAGDLFERAGVSPEGWHHG